VSLEIEKNQRRGAETQRRRGFLLSWSSLS
jgi:hypothetical protein